MNLARIVLLLLILGAIRFIVVGGWNEGFLIAVIGFAAVLGFLDRRLRQSPLASRPAHRQGASVAGLPEDADEGSAD
jgi:hypothetical protein